MASESAVTLRGVPPEESTTYKLLVLTRLEGSSPDGTEMALFSIGEHQEDVFLARIDGSGMRRLTDDAHRDRAPMFAYDGKSVVFYSNRDGNWTGWAMRTDGSGLRNLPAVPDGVVYPIPSPIDDRVVFSGSNGKHVYVMRLNGNSKPELLPATWVNDAMLMPTSWSPDGKRIAGPIAAQSGRFVGVGMYDLAARTMTPLCDDQTAAVRWLPDGRRLVYFAADGAELVTLDTVTKERRVVPVQLPGPSAAEVIALSRDGRTIYYGAVRAQSDIWLAETR